MAQSEEYKQYKQDFMITISGTEFHRNLAKYQDAALSQPVIVTHNGRERIVLLSAEAFHELQRRSREVLPVEALSSADLAAIASAEVPAEHRHLDSELDPRQ
jgi:prevent-host-death family protein